MDVANTQLDGLANILLEGLLTAQEQDMNNYLPMEYLNKTPEEKTQAANDISTTAYIQINKEINSCSKTSCNLNFTLKNIENFTIWSFVPALRQETLPFYKAKDVRIEHTFSKVLLLGGVLLEEVLLVVRTRGITSYCTAKNYTNIEKSECLKYEFEKMEEKTSVFPSKKYYANTDCAAFIPLKQAELLEDNMREQYYKATNPFSKFHYKAIGKTVNTCVEQLSAELYKEPCFVGDSFYHSGQALSQSLITAIKFTVCTRGELTNELK